MKVGAQVKSRDAFDIVRVRRRVDAARIPERDGARHRPVRPRNQIGVALEIRSAKLAGCGVVRAAGEAEASPSAIAPAVAALLAAVSVDARISRVAERLRIVRERLGAIRQPRPDQRDARGSVGQRFLEPRVGPRLASRLGEKVPNPQACGNIGRRKLHLQFGRKRRKNGGVASRRNCAK